MVKLKRWHRLNAYSVVRSIVYLAKKSGKKTLLMCSHAQNTLKKMLILIEIYFLLCSIDLVFW